MPVDLVQAEEGEPRHRSRESRSYQVFQELELRRPNIFGGAGRSMHRQACQASLQVASTEGEHNILGGCWLVARK